MNAAFFSSGTITMQYAFSSSSCRNALVRRSHDLGQHGRRFGQAPGRLVVLGAQGRKREYRRHHRRDCDSGRVSSCCCVSHSSPFSSCHLGSSRGSRAGFCACPRPRASVPARPGVTRPSRARPPSPHGGRYPRRCVRLQRSDVPLRLRLVPPPRFRAAASRAARASSARRRTLRLLRDDSFTASRPSKESRQPRLHRLPRCSTLISWYPRHGIRACASLLTAWRGIPVVGHDRIDEFLVVSGAVQAARCSASIRVTASFLSIAASLPIRISPERSACGTRRSSASMSSRSAAMTSDGEDSAVIRRSLIWCASVHVARRATHRPGSVLGPFGHHRDDGLGRQQERRNRGGVLSAERTTLVGSITPPSTRFS